MSEEQNNNNLTEDGEDLQEALAKKESDLLLAAQLGKQLLDKNAELTEQLEEVDRLYNDLKEKHDHLVAQYTSATTELKNAELQKQSLFQEVDELRERTKTMTRDLEEKESLQTQYREVMQLMEIQKGELETLRVTSDDQSKQLQKLQTEKTKAISQLGDASQDAAELEKLRKEVEELRSKSALQQQLDEALEKLQEENESLSVKLRETADLQEKLKVLTERNEALESQNAETVALLEEVRTTAASLTEAMASSMNSEQNNNDGFSLADELGVDDNAGSNNNSARDEEEARRLREERKKQQDLLALLSQQLKKAENSMKGIEQEADELRRELIKREQARKSGYLMKRGFYFGTWKRRFCMLDAGYLHYGESPNRAFDGIVLLRGARVEHSPETASKRAHCFSVANRNRTYYFAAETEEEMVDWIVAVMAVIKEANSPSEIAQRIREEAGTAFVNPITKKSLDNERLMMGVYENQRRRTPLHSFESTSIKWKDRPQWSDRDGVDVCGAVGVFTDNQQPTAKSGWVVIVNCKVKDVERKGYASSRQNPPTDTDGWEYALSFSSEEWSPECGVTCFVRRRRWVKKEALDLMKEEGDPLKRRQSIKDTGKSSNSTSVIHGDKPVVAK